MFTLPELSYDTGAFEGFASAEMFSFHHGKHHAGYVKKLNAALEGTDYDTSSVEAVITASRSAGDGKVFNNAAQHFNHAFFWNCLTPESSGVGRDLQELIDRDFGSVDQLKESFAEVAATHFGSGWAWLVQEADGTLAVRGYHDAETPAGSDVTPLLTLDVWEHAYYIDHRNDRGGYIEAFWPYVNWAFVEHQAATIRDGQSPQT